jgi:hypothetical protein
MLLSSVDGGKMQNPEALMQSLIKPVFDELLELDDYKMPRIVAGFKVSSESDRARYTELLQGTFAKAIKLEKLTPPSRFCSVAYLEDGFKIDSFHGSESGIYDLDTKRKLAV